MATVGNASEGWQMVLSEAPDTQGTPESLLSEAYHVGLLSDMREWDSDDPDVVRAAVFRIATRTNALLAITEKNNLPNRRFSDFFHNMIPVLCHKGNCDFSDLKLRHVGEEDIDLIVEEARRQAAYAAEGREEYERGQAWLMRGAFI